MSDSAYFWKKKVAVSYVLSVLVFWIHCSSFRNYTESSACVVSIDFLFTKAFNAAAVPLFMIMAGAAFFRNYNSNQYTAKLKRRVTTLLIPYLCWNTLNVLFNMAASAFLSDYFIGREVFVYSWENILRGIFLYGENMQF